MTAAQQVDKQSMLAASSVFPRFDSGSSLASRSSDKPNHEAKHSSSNRNELIANFMRALVAHDKKQTTTTSSSSNHTVSTP